MRENRTHGSEGRETGYSTGLPYPYRGIQFVFEESTIITQICFSIWGREMILITLEKNSVFARPLTSVVSQADGVLSRAAFARVTFSRMSAALAVQVIV